MLRSTSLAGPIFFALTATSGCSSVLGLDDFEAARGSTTASSSAASSGTTELTGSSSGSSSTGSGSSTGEGGGGGGEQGGGGAGGGEPCDDEGAAEDCYEGDLDTLGVGSCVAGERRCEDGFWTACEEQVLPDEEDLATWTDESCVADAAELLGFARYDGTSDDYPVGLGGFEASDSLMAAVGIFGTLTVGGETYSTNTDLGTVLIRYAADGTLEGSRFIPGGGSGFATGSGYAILTGAAVPQVVDGVALPAEFLAMLDPQGTLKFAIEASCAGVNEQHVACGETLYRLTPNVAEWTLTRTPVADFGPHWMNTWVRNGGQVIVGGQTRAASPVATCTTTAADRDGYLAVLASSSGACAAYHPLGATGAASVSHIVRADNRLFVAGIFSGTLRDENETLLISEGSASAFVARFVLASDGTPSLIWLRAFGGGGFTSATRLIMDDEGGVGATVQIDDTVDFGEFEADGPTAFVHLDFEGNVRYARSMGAGVDAFVGRVGNRVAFMGFLRPDAEPFELADVPSAGGLDDAFLSVHALP